MCRWLHGNGHGEEALRRHEGLASNLVSSEGFFFEARDGDGHVPLVQCCARCQPRLVDELAELVIVQVVRGKHDAMVITQVQRWGRCPKIQSGVNTTVNSDSASGNRESESFAALDERRSRDGAQDNSAVNTANNRHAPKGSKNVDKGVAAVGDAEVAGRRVAISLIGAFENISSRFHQGNLMLRRQDEESGHGFARWTAHLRVFKCLGGARNLSNTWVQHSVPTQVGDNPFRQLSNRCHSVVFFGPYRDQRA
mmetsp:Transcript_47596/g.112009  ORF Transcript_47596/g.112009 Transcript_47596/m.112009 type:complete len:253 (+) Transcript_47596:304-1062(+)